MHILPYGINGRPFSNKKLKSDSPRSNNRNDDVVKNTKSSSEVGVNLPFYAYRSSVAINKGYNSYEPYYRFQEKLLEDGYSVFDLVQANLYLPKDGRNVIDLGSLPETRKRIHANVNGLKLKIQKAGKDGEDVEAMTKAYGALKDKFMNQELIDSLEEEARAAAELIELGFEPGDRPPSLQNRRLLLLETLGGVNKHNEAILETLLDDENFSNFYLMHAISGIKDDTRRAYAQQILDKARSKGYDKEFSFALGTIMANANRGNMPQIDKMLEEIDYLIENPDFVADGMLDFLKTPSNLAAKYVSDNSMTLADVDSYMRLKFLYNTEMM